jgi:hypothetical protein
MSISLTKLWRDGLAHDRSAHVENEKAKFGNLRAGDSGAMLPTGDVMGGCHRRAYVRTQLGIEVDPPSFDRTIMFELGKANETIWMDKLQRVWWGTIKQEEEIPISWSTSNGTRVTGRPDIVLCDEKGKPLLVIEHKAACSIWTSRDVSFVGVPKTKHLVQAVHYAWQLKVPSRLVYTQYVDYAMPDFAKSFFPVGDPRVSLNDKGQVKAVLPHETIYEVEIGPKGSVSYRREGDERTPTVAVFSTGDIARFYEFVSTMAENKTLGPRPSSLKPTGEKMSYNECNYCPLFETCKKYEHSWEKWNEAVKEHK